VGAGLPGLGLGGLLFIILGLLAPVVEAVRTIAGRSSLTRWRIALRQFALSATIVVALDRAFWLVDRAVGVRAGPQASLGPALPVTPVVITALFLVAVLASATLLGWLVRALTARRHRDATVVIDLSGEPAMVTSTTSDASTG
jgi:hypothetical protein